MKSFTRVGLPILLVFGVVFGITFIQMYTEPETPTEGPRSADPKKTSASSGPPLKFFTLRAAAPREEATSSGEMRIARHLLHFKYWQPEVEVGAPGHYEFWCQNRHPEPVTVRVPTTNCQCAGVEMAVVPADALRDYQIESALATSPLSPAPGVLAAVAHASLSRKLNWEILNRDAERQERTVPAAAGTDRPQMALVRLTWAGKAPIGPKTISADLYAGLPNAPAPSHTPLTADISVVPAFYPLRRDTATHWTPLRDLSVGDLGENAASTQEFFLASSTRNHLLYSVTPEVPDPCISITDPTPATPEEWASLTDFLRQERGEEGSSNIRRPRSLYKVRVTVRERTAVPGEKEPRHLDLGPLDRKITVSAVDGGAVVVGVRGRVLGEVTILNGATDGRIDLGNFSAAEDRSKDVALSADRRGLDLTLLEAETRPGFLKVKLEPLPNTPDGRKQWRLRVTVPKGSLYGALPETAGVILKTNAANPRRFRLPIRGMTYDSGGPRL